MGIPCPQCRNELESNICAAEDTRDGSGRVWDCKQCETWFEESQIAKLHCVAFEHNDSCSLMNHDNAL